MNVTALKDVSWHNHEKMEQLPFVVSLVEKTLPLQSYVGQLRGFAALFATAAHAAVRLPALAGDSIGSSLSDRYAMLCADLSYFAGTMVPDILPAVKSALDTAAMIRNASSGELLGYVYVLQGTMRGNQFHLPDIKACFKLEEQGASFYRGFDGRTDEVWKEFSTALGTADSTLAEDAARAASVMYGRLLHFHRLLYPVPEGGSGFSATGLNPEAGDHPVPQRQDVLEAALRAGTRCWQEFSYYERRYGDRGKRFTASDTAWMAALAEQQQNVILEQVNWLGRLLSVRGMPTLLLERQLAILHEELAAVPSAEYNGQFTAVLETVRAQRFEIASQNTLDEVCRRLTELLEPGHFSDAPLILAAAQLDARRGIPECRSNVQTWFLEKGIMPATLQDKVNELLETI